jgi:hypothetical protein
VTSVPIDTELRELLTTPSGTISYVVSVASSYLDITASRAFDILGSAPLRFPARPTSAASAAQTTFAAFCRLTIEGHRTLTLILTCSPSLPRPTFAASAAEQDQQPSAARLSGPSVAPNFDARVSNGSLPFPQPKRCMTDLCSRVLPREPLSFAASAAARNTTGLRRYVSLAETTRHKPLGRNGTELTWRPRKDATDFSRRAAFWPPWVFLLRGFSQGCTTLGLQLLAILGIMDFLP